MPGTPPVMPDQYFVRFVETPQGRVHSRTLGQPRSPAPPVVAVMGMAVSSYLLPALAILTRWTQAHLVDLPGLAGSGPPTRPLDVTGYAAAVATWLDHARLPPVVLIGHSSGTQTAAHVAAMRPERVRALVLASPTVDPKARSWPRLAWCWARDTRYPLPGLSEQHHPEWRRAGARGILHLVSVHLRDHLEDVVPRVSCPVLVLRGDADRISTETWARQLAGLAAEGRFAAVPGPHTFVWYDPAAWDAPIRDLAAHACDGTPGERR